MPACLCQGGPEQSAADAKRLMVNRADNRMTTNMTGISRFGDALAESRHQQWNADRAQEKPGAENHREIAESGGDDVHACAVSGVDRGDFFGREVAGQNDFEHFDVFAVTDLAVTNFGRLVHA